MPVREELYKSNRLFPFFEGLIPEGWLLNIASKNWKINPNDQMGLLLACCQNCIGALSVQPIAEENEA
jgi:serine/threonine-protein kinase HipA